MTTVREIDRLVVSNDALAARLWPGLGPKVRGAYLRDRDAWVVLRRTVEAGASLPTATLAAEQKVFLGWGRALRAAAAGKTKRPRPVTVARRAGAPASAAAAAAASSTRAIFPPPTAASTPPAATAAAAVTKVKGGAGTAVAGGLVLAGLIAVAARRKRA